MSLLYLLPMLLPYTYQSPGSTIWEFAADCGEFKIFYTTGGNNRPYIHDLAFHGFVNILPERE